MRRIAWIASLLIPLHALPSGALEAMRASAPTASPSLEIRAEAPPIQFSALGLLAPGTPQFLLGQPLKGSAFLAGTAALGVGTYFLLRMAFYGESFEPGAFYPPESDALIMLNAAGISWLTAGALSTLDAFLTLRAMPPNSEASASATPEPAPTAVPTPVATPGPIPVPTPLPTPLPSPAAPLSPPRAPVMPAAPAPAPSVTPPPLPSSAPQPKPSASPQSPALPDPETAVYQAYDLATQERYLEAVVLIQTIRDPGWLPKANALLAEWGPKAVEQGLDMVRKRLEAGDRAVAAAILERLSPLPKTPAQARLMEALNQRLR